MVKATGVTQPTDKVRLGRLTECDQPHNSIVLNASNAKIDNIEHSGFYVSPIRSSYSSNLLAYDTTTKEIVDIGGHKLKISSLEVENLDVVNSNTVHNYYVDNPIFEIAKGTPRTTEDIGIVMHRVGGNVDIKFSEKDNHLSINKDLCVDGTIKAKFFEGDAGLLSNVQLDFEIGDTFENLNVTRELRADGSLLSNISIKQLKDLDGASLDLENVYLNGALRSKKSIYSQTSVIAPSFVGDGRKLEGIALKEDVETHTKDIEEIRTILPNIKKVENEIKRVETSIPNLGPIENKVNEVEKSIPSLEPLNLRVGTLETLSQNLNHKIQDVEQSVKEFKPEKVDLTHIENSIEKLKIDLNKIDKVEKNIEPKFLHLHRIIDNIPKIPDLTTPLSQLNSKIQTITTEFEKSIKLTKINVLKNISITEKKLETLVNEIQKVENRIPILESYISNVHTIENDVVIFKEDIPKLDDRIKSLEEYTPPLPTLQSVTTCESNTVCSVTFENPGTSMSTLGNIGVGTNTPSSRISIYSEPNITSELGEVNAIKINELAQINAYTKANAGLSSGRPGGIVFKTKRPNGSLGDSMTIDGNGSVTIGSSTAYKCASLSINSTTGGLLVPRLTSEQIENIKKPEPGLIVYDKEKDTFVGYKKSGWTELF